MFPWLSRRGMNIGQFSKLVEGRVPPHTPDQLDHKVNIMRKYQWSIESDCDRVFSWPQLEVRARVSLAWAARLTGWTTCLCCGTAPRSPTSWTPPSPAPGPRTPGSSLSSRMIRWPR